MEKPLGVGTLVVDGATTAPDADFSSTAERELDVLLSGATGGVRLVATDVLRFLKRKSLLRGHRSAEDHAV
jgi:hypothetical protein